MNRYCCFCDGWQVFIYAMSWREARDAAVEHFKPKSINDITVRIAQ